MTYRICPMLLHGGTCDPICECSDAEIQLECLPWALADYLEFLQDAVPANCHFGAFYFETVMETYPSYDAALHELIGDLP